MTSQLLAAEKKTPKTGQLCHQGSSYFVTTLVAMLVPPSFHNNQNRSNLVMDTVDSIV